MLAVGQNVPAFQLRNQDGESRSQSDYAGRWLVLYVYPKDDTPGCTIQGQSFTATKEDFEQKGIRVVGVSADDVDAHKHFCSKYSLTVELLADPEAQLLSSLGVGQTEWNGVRYWDRTTFVFDPKGVLQKVYDKVNPKGHEELLLREVSALQTAQG